MGGTAGGPLRSSGAQHALQMLLAQAGEAERSAVTTLAGAPAPTPAAPAQSRDLSTASSGAVSIDPQSGGNGGVPTDDGTGSPGVAPPSATAAANVPATSSTLDAVNAANAAGTAMADPARTAAAASHAASAGASSTTLSLQTQLRAPLGTVEWTDELGTQLTWMAHHGIGSASLQVSPPDLGPIQVRIAVHGSAASVWFGAAQADTRAALEQALPRLHELFGAQGLALADANVSREQPGEQREAGAAVWAGSGVPQQSTDPGAQGATALQRLGLVDLYA
ncbi:MAG TPA: flagellar hook-length control protein FliK [Steroidobacteraceae bacterium]|nr:flagellar hook-length control protein FliK [Steroidobacteraceae bacterium]